MEKKRKWMKKPAEKAQF